MSWTKYNNPNKKRKPKRKSPYSSQYISERREEMYRLLADTNSEFEQNAIIKAFHVSINP